MESRIKECFNQSHCLLPLCFPQYLGPRSLSLKPDYPKAKESISYK